MRVEDNERRAGGTAPAQKNAKNDNSSNLRIPHNELLDTGIACCDHKLQYQPDTNKVYCPVCKRYGVDIETLPEHEQQLILQGLLYV